MGYPIHNTHNIPGFDNRCSYCGVGIHEQNIQLVCLQQPPAPPQAPAAPTPVATWAMTEARKRAGIVETFPDYKTARLLIELALMIERHETEPVDPLVKRARQIALSAGFAQAILDTMDGKDAMSVAIITALTEAQPVKLPHDVVTHRQAWHKALKIARDCSDSEDNDGYWQYELDAFDKTFNALAKYDCTGE